jgi:phosphatidylglycerol lysyltransferase
MTDPRGPWAARLLGVLRVAWPWALLAVVALFGWKELKEVDLARVRELVHETRPGSLLVIVLATGLNLVIAGSYDVVAMGSRSEPPPSAERWRNGALAFAWSNFLTIGPLAGPALRLWLYRPTGASRDRIARGIGRIVAAFATSLALFLAAAFVPLPAGIDGLAARGLLGAALCAATAALIGGRRRTAWLPLAAIAWADWMSGWLVFDLAVRSQVPAIERLETFSTFVLGQAVGVASFVPGGLGSADLVWGTRLATAAGARDHVTAALVLYRAIYYAAPFVAAGLVLAGRALAAKRKTARLVRTGLASYTFVCGIVLLVSAASPALTARAHALASAVPLAIVELSHAASVVLGFLLLVLSRGLARGYRSSHRLAIALFLGAALATFLKGLDYEEALLALAAAGLLVAARAAFRREGRLHPSLEFVVSAGVAAVIVFAAVGIGSYESWPGLPEAFRRFDLMAHAERFVRGLVLLAASGALVAMWFGQRPRRPDTLPDPATIDLAIVLARRLASTTNALLVAAGDKALFREKSGDPAFIAYRSQGRFLVAWSNPVAPPGRAVEMLAAFVEHASDWDREALLYQLTPALLPAAHDLGFLFFKLGEEALVDLDAFDLKGNAAKTHRNVLNAVERAGGGFAIVEGKAVNAVLPELREVSDAWRRAKGAAEKGFSLGRFDEAYLERFPLALVRNASGRVAAFANVLALENREEMSVDLMRYRPDDTLPHAMECLVIRLMLHAKDGGYRRFNLGVAPLAEVGARRRARPSERLAHQLFVHGEPWYNYQGLRRFKERFHPVWEPRYLAYRKPWDLPFALAALAQLISGGWRAVLPARGSAA